MRETGSRVCFHFPSHLLFLLAMLAVVMCSRVRKLYLHAVACHTISQQNIGGSGDAAAPSPYQSFLFLFFLSICSYMSVFPSSPVLLLLLLLPQLPLC